MKNVFSVSVSNLFGCTKKHRLAQSMVTIMFYIGTLTLSNYMGLGVVIPQKEPSTDCTRIY